MKRFNISGGKILSIVGLVLGLVGGLISDKKQSIAIDNAVSKELNNRGYIEKKEEEKEE